MCKRWFNGILVLGLLVGSVQAAVITWEGPFDVTAAEDVVAEGDTVEAVNCYVPGSVANVTTVDPVVNAVQFTGSNKILGNGYTQSQTFFSGSTGDTAYDDLLNTLDFGGGGNLFTKDLGGGNLQVGQQYLIQVWYVDTRYSTTPRVMQFGDGNGNTVDLASSPGQYAIGTFTADGVTQALSFDAVGFGNAHITAYQIRETTSVPVPTLSTTAVSPVSGNFTVDIDFTEAMTGLEESDFSVVNGKVQASSLSGSGVNWSLVIVPAANGDVSVTLPANSVMDIDGDDNGNPESNTLVMLYLSPGSDQPSAVLSTASSVVTGPFIVDIVFDEAVTGLELSDFLISDGTLSDLTGSDASYSVLVTPSSGGDVTISLPAGMVTDTDGDNLKNVASAELVTAYVKPISVSIYGPLATTETEFDVYLTFSDGVSSLEISDFEVVNGSVLSITEQGRRDFADRYYIVSLGASAPGTVTITLPAGVVNDAYTHTVGNGASSLFAVECTSDFNEQWIVDDEASWTAATGLASNLTVSGGFAEPTADTAQFTSVIKTFAKKKKATSITFGQSPVWDNWTGVSNVGPSGARDAPVFVPFADNDYYFLGLGSTGGYHAWHSTDMVNWVEYGPVTAPTTGRWVTSAEYKDGVFYIYSDYYNDHTPHLFKDSDLKDGVAGTYMGAAFVKEPSGSDCSLFRNDEDGLFHLIYEDWSPINAQTHSWDSSLAGHTSSVDGLTGFIPHEHVPPVDHRTNPTGTYGTYNHPNKSGVVYEIHEPEQDAFGDWTSIKIGSQFYLFCDYDHADGGIQVGRFTSDSIYKQYDLVGSLGSGHPDPTVGFAEGQFYLITQTSTDYVSPGPWVDGVEARAGVDTDGDGTIDQWTAWQTVSEHYDHTPGFIRVVTLTPARLDLSELAEGYGFQYEFRIDNTVVANVSPIMDRVEMDFEPANFQQLANTNGIPAEAGAD